MLLRSRVNCENPYTNLKNLKKSILREPCQPVKIKKDKEWFDVKPLVRPFWDLISTPPSSAMGQDQNLNHFKATN